MRASAKFWLRAAGLEGVGRSHFIGNLAEFRGAFRGPIGLSISALSREWSLKSQESVIAASTGGE
jgi:hypothetical protein